MRSKKKIIGLSVFLLFLFFVLHTCSGGLISPLPYRHLVSFTGKVIDADTKKPITGAAVLAVYYTSVYTVAGENSFVVDGQESLTDEHGEFTIPKKNRWFTISRGYPEGRLEIFKPGYGTLWHERSRAIGVNKSWPPPKEYIVYELPKLNTRQERDKNLPSLHLENISKKKYTIFLRLINQERTYLGYEKLPMD